MAKGLETDAVLGRRYLDGHNEIDLSGVQIQIGRYFVRLTLSRVGKV